MSAWYSWLLFPFGLLGQIMVSRKRRHGYLVGLFTQALWLVYVVQTRQWSLLAGTLSYTVVYADAYVAWKNPGRKTGIEALALRLWRWLRPAKRESE